MLDPRLMARFIVMGRLVMIVTLLMVVLICGGFHNWGYPKNGWFIRENPTKMDEG